jgi:hypothetical protein
MPGYRISEETPDLLLLRLVGNRGSNETIGMFVDDGSLAPAILFVTGSAALLALCFEASYLAAIVLLVG